ncbi:MAG: hypothetical protein BGO31_12665 [Bacteroidetes bacterium 43-16]|nr:MAG: hypothetical protein BGO31_12665 [Bacteroidetes bacterium 43-16]
MARRAFVENIGQVTDQYRNKRPDIVAKYVPNNGLNIFLSKSGIVYQWSTDSILYRMDVNLLNAKKNPVITFQDPTAFKERYHLESVRGEARSFRKVTYHDIYPAIDWVFYFNADGELEHDFIVREGADPSDIQLNYLGAENLTVDKAGSLIATTKFGSIKEPAPFSYEAYTGKKIRSSYSVNKDVVTFFVDPYQGKLVIDPVIDWSSYFGGSEYDEIRAVKVGKDGQVYAVGSTNSTTNIATVGAHLTSFQGGSNASGSDAFIAKFDADGNCLWSTYYGGSNIDLGFSLAVDTAGYLYIAGRTNSQSGIATTGSHQSFKAGNASGYDAFVVKFDTAGLPLWGTYFGGNFNEGTTGLAISADKYNNIYLAGNTNSSSGLSTLGAFQQTRPGGEEGFIAKFSTAGNLRWATYFGSSMNDFVNAITTDTAGEIIIAGHTAGTTGLATAGTHLQTGNGGTDGFVAKFDTAGQRIWGTYYGGAGVDVVNALTIDSSSNAIYLAGATNSITGIATATAHQNTIGGTSWDDAFIAKLNTNGTLDWATYYGGDGADYIYALHATSSKLYAAGLTTSASGISTPDAITALYNTSPSEGVLAMFSSSGQRLWATYLGGDAADEFRAMAVRDTQDVFIAGKTNSVAGLSTQSAHQTSFQGVQDGLLMRIRMCQLPTTPLSISGEITACENTVQEYIVDGSLHADSFIWLLPTGWTGFSATDTLMTTVGTNAGEIKVVAVNNCGLSDTFSLNVSVIPAPTPVVNRSGNILSVTQTYPSYQWLLNGNPIAGATDPTLIVTSNGNYAIEVVGANGCTGSSNTIAVDNFTSIETLSKLGLHVYPNPFSDRIFMESVQPMNIVMFDISGRVVARHNIAKGINALDVSILPAGNYVLNFFHPQTLELLGATTLVKPAL